jgi:hypothetical protein
MGRGTVNRPPENEGWGALVARKPRGASRRATDRCLKENRGRKIPKYIRLKAPRFAVETGAGGKGDSGSLLEVVDESRW